jgi:phosphorylcholine metabolism protein LicD
MYNNIKNIIPILVIILLILCIILWYKKTIKDGFTVNAMDKINGVIYINLDNREDRKKLLLEELLKMGIPSSKIHKVSGIYVPKNGHKGCVQSHILALNIAKMNNWDTTLILEDDAELNVSEEEFKSKLSNIFDFLKDKEWDVIMLGKCNTVEKETINEFIKLKSGTTSTGYIIKKHYYNKLLDLFIDCNNKMIPDKWGDTNNFEPNALDQRWQLLQGKDNWYGFKKDLLRQRNIWSTINNKGSKGDKVEGLTNNNLDNLDKQNKFNVCLKDMKHILDENNIVFFLCYGTLLGQRRENKFIEYDHDIDIGIFSKDYKTNIKDIIVNSGKFKFVHDFGNYDKNNYEMTFLNIETNVRIDIMIFFKEDNEDLYYSSSYTGLCDKKKLGYCKWKRHIRGLKQIMFFNTYYLVPKNTDEFLEETYGNDWKIPKNFSYYEGLDKGYYKE